MKKFYTFSLALAASLSMVAAQSAPKLEISTEPLPAEVEQAIRDALSHKVNNAQPKSFKDQVIEAGNVQLQNVDTKVKAKANSAVSKAVSVTNDSWTDLGNQQFQDPSLTVFGAGTMSYEVPVRQNTDQPGIYQLVNPFACNNSDYSSYVSAEVEQNWNFDATDPDKVIADVIYNAYNLSGSLSSYGSVSLYPITGYYLDKGYSSYLTDSDYGVLSDGKITFAAGTIAVNLSGMGSSLYSLSGDLVISLPGAKYYNADVAAENNCNADNKFSVYVSLGADVASAKIMVYPADIEGSDEVYAYVASSAYSSSFSASAQFTVDLSSDTEHGVYTILVATLDADGNVKGGGRTVVFVQPDESANWKSIGNGKYTEGIMCEYYNGFESQTAEVEIEESIANPGYFRLVNPYASMTAGPSYKSNIHATDHNHYMYINATNADQVYIEESPLGMDFSDGEIIVNSYANYLLEYGYDAATIAAQSTQFFGTMADNAITFPAKMIFVGEVYYKDLGWTQVNKNSYFKVELPASYGGVNDVIVDQAANGAVEYFNLQGVRVDNPAKGQLVIKRQGDKASKVIIK